MKSNTKTSWFSIPLMIVVVIFLILGSLFRIESVEISQTLDEENDLLTIMPRSNRDTFLLEQEARDELDDPTIFSLPHQKLGFSQVLENEGEPPKPSLPVYKVSARSISELERPRIPLVGIYKEPGVGDGNTLVKPELPMVELALGAKTYTRRIVWLEDGKEKLCPLDEKLVVEAAKGLVPVQNTRIMLKKLSESYICFLVEKCGVAELDDLVLEYTQQKLKLLYTGDLLFKDLPEEIVVDWRLVITSAKTPN